MNPMYERILTFQVTIFARIDLQMPRLRCMHFVCLFFLRIVVPLHCSCYRQCWTDVDTHGLQLFDAALNGRADDVRELLSDGVSPHAEDEVRFFLNRICVVFCAVASASVEDKTPDAFL